MKNKSRYWVVVAVGISEEHGQIVASFLSFDAPNRFLAFKEIERLLPQNPKWVSSGGELLDFSLFAFHQCAPHEVNGYAEEYMRALMDMFPQFDSLSGAVPA